MTAQTISPTTITTDATYFDRVYREAAGDLSRIPWASGRPSAALVNWMNAIAPSLIRCGSRVAVPGSGLGDDAREIMRRGYDVVALDSSRTAVQWARDRFPQMAGAFYEADLFNLPGRWKRRFDLVADVNNLHLLSPDWRQRALSSAAELMAPHGRLLVIAQAMGHDELEPDGPPWPVSASELQELAAVAGLEADDSVAVFEDDEEAPPVQRLRALFRRA